MVKFHRFSTFNICQVTLCWSVDRESGYFSPLDLVLFYPHLRIHHTLVVYHSLHNDLSSYIGVLLWCAVGCMGFWVRFTSKGIWCCCHSGLPDSTFHWPCLSLDHIRVPCLISPIGLFECAVDMSGKWTGDNTSALIHNCIAYLSSLCLEHVCAVWGASIVYGHDAHISQSMLYPLICLV